MDELTERILQLKAEKDAVILAHYYVPGDVQDIADFIGDSYYLSKIAAQVTEKVIVFCGVAFMGESAKMLNPDKVVLMPDLKADCPMAHMVKIRDIQKIRETYEDVAVVCYINSTAEIKARCLRHLVECEKRHHCPSQPLYLFHSRRAPGQIHFPSASREDVPLQ